MDTKQRNYTILTKFMKTDWSDSVDLENIKNGAIDDLPILPLDFQLSRSSIKELSDIYDQNQEQSHSICTTTNLPDTYQKLTIFGPDSLEDYKKFHLSTHTSSSWDEFNDIMDNMDLDWRLPANHLRKEMESFPYKRLYTIEYFCKKPGEYSSVHIDRDNKKLWKGVHNRIYVPLDWDDTMEFGCYGLGKFVMEPGRFYALNGNAYIHGAWNLSPEKTCKSIIVVADNHCQSYDDLVKVSYAKHNLYK